LFQYRSSELALYCWPRCDGSVIGRFPGLVIFTVCLPPTVSVQPYSSRSFLASRWFNVLGGLFKGCSPLFGATMTKAPIATQHRQTGEGHRTHGWCTGPGVLKWDGLALCLQSHSWDTRILFQPAPVLAAQEMGAHAGASQNSVGASLASVRA